jgi:dTDP-4-dehydrorhamnose reductase
VPSILVTGANGQLARSLVEAASGSLRGGMRLVALGRQEMDITHPDMIDAALCAHEPGVVVNCAAYTDVDKAESEEQRAFAVNSDGAGIVASSCAIHGIPLIHISTDYVFDGAKAEPYVESDPTGSTGVYGCTKLEGEARVVAACPEHIVLRSAWVHSPFGHNFVKTMLRLARTRAEIPVVDDQVGSPSYALHLADAILEIARQILEEPAGEPRWGVYHIAGTGETSWCGLAREIFAQSEKHGGPSARIRPISTADYPTSAKRPANSRLDCTALKTGFGIALPDWRVGVEACVARALATTS